MEQKVGDKLAHDTLPVKSPIAWKSLVAICCQHILLLRLSFLLAWSICGRLLQPWVLHMWVVCTADGLFALADIPVETDMLLSLIQSLVVDPENERLVRKMSHKPAISGNQQVRKAPRTAGRSTVLTLLETVFPASSLFIIRQQGHSSNLCTVCLQRLYVCNSFLNPCVALTGIKQNKPHGFQDSRNFSPATGG